MTASLSSGGMPGRTRDSGRGSTLSRWGFMHLTRRKAAGTARLRTMMSTMPGKHPGKVGGIGEVECVHVEHEEVLLIPRWVDAKRVTFKYGLGEEFIDVLKTLHKLGLDRTAVDRADTRDDPVGGQVPRQGVDE